MEPIAGQFVMDFAPRDNLVAAKVKYMRPAETAEEFFRKGVALEEDPSTQPEAMECYRRALEQEPEHAAAHINLGTLYYNHQDYAEAEKHYRQATIADPRYALAYFDLGNVLDETGRLPEAVRAYRQAITLAPTYADAHYNLALGYEKMGQQRKALEHWQAYVRLDARGPWSVHARSQIRKILEGDPLQVVFRKARS
jgi:tetratricopeptide (TPR) repeat protein